MAYRRRKQEEVTKVQFILKWFVDLTVVIGAAIFIGVFFCEKLPVTGYSMLPALTNNEKILIDKLIYHFKDPERFDIVIFSPKGEKSSLYVKRVIALPGETVQILNGTIYINGEKLEEPIETDKILNAGSAETAFTLGEYEYFLLGDNRNNSEDSRFQTVGNVKLNEIIGKAWLRVTTLNDVGWIE